MNQQRVKPSLCVKKGGESFLSGESFAGLLQATLEKDVPFRFRTKGVSMLPYIKEGDCVTIYPKNNISLARGDVVAFIHTVTGKLAVHRIIDKKDKFYVVKGDNNLQSDGLIPGTSILGIVRRVERDGKNVYIGFGPEKPLIAFLSRKHKINHLLFFLRRLLRLTVRPAV